jgi:hypothetical protein
MTDEDMAEYVRRSRAAQGLPPTIEDEEALDSFVALMAAALTRVGQSRKHKSGSGNGRLGRSVVEPGGMADPADDEIAGCA